jgi:hypothetical protein
MSMTSNSRASATRLAAAALLLGACIPPGTVPGVLPPAASAPDAPRPAPPRSTAQVPPSSGAAQEQLRPVEIRSARVRPVRGDSLVMRLVGAARMGEARDPVLIEVTTAEPLGDVARSSSPEIYLNGERVGETWPRPPNQLFAYLPDRQLLRGRVEVTVAWLGDEERTRSRRPVVLQEP